MDSSLSTLVYCPLWGLDPYGFVFRLLPKMSQYKPQQSPPWRIFTSLKKTNHGLKTTPRAIGRGISHLASEDILQVQVVLEIFYGNRLELVWKPHGSLLIHIGMILFTLGLSPHGFVFEVFPQKASYQLDVLHAYELISLPITNRCGTLWDFGLKPNNYFL